MLQRYWRFEPIPTQHGKCVNEQVCRVGVIDKQVKNNARYVCEYFAFPNVIQRIQFHA